MKVRNKNSHKMWEFIHPSSLVIEIPTSIYEKHKFLDVNQTLTPFSRNYIRGITSYKMELPIKIKFPCVPNNHLNSILLRSTCFITFSHPTNILP